MKCIGKQDLGNVLVETGFDYKFIVVDDECQNICPGVEVVPIVTKGKLDIYPQRVKTDQYGIGEFRVNVNSDAAGQCGFELKPTEA